MNTKYSNDDPHKPAMTYQEIADTLSAEEGKPYSEEQIRKICTRAIQKLRKHLGITVS